MHDRHWFFTMKDVARATGLLVQKVRNDRLRGIFVASDLMSVVNYVIKNRGVK